MKPNIKKMNWLELERAKDQLALIWQYSTVQEAVIKAEEDLADVLAERRRRRDNAREFVAAVKESKYQTR